MVTKEEFILKTLQVFDECMTDGPTFDDLHWKFDGDKIKFFINCEDSFTEGLKKDYEPFEEEDIPVILKMVEELRAIKNKDGSNGFFEVFADTLLVAHKRKKLPRMETFFAMGDNKEEVTKLFEEYTK